MKTPTFGLRNDTEYTDRSAAYALLERGEEVGVVVGRDGALFLPGGGIEGDETPGEAVLREIREECGRGARVLSRWGEAVQYFEAVSEKTFFRAHMTFYVCEFTPGVAEEGEHVFSWIDRRTDPGRFANEAHVWAIRARGVDLAGATGHGE